MKAWLDRESARFLKDFYGVPDDVPLGGDKPPIPELAGYRTTGLGANEDGMDGFGLWIKGIPLGIISLCPDLDIWLAMNIDE